MGQHRNPPAHRQALPKPEKSGFRGDGGTNRFHEVRGGIARVAMMAIMEISSLMFPSLRYNETRTTVLSGMSKLRYVVCRWHQSFHLRAPLGQYLYPSQNRWVFQQVAGRRLGTIFRYGTMSSKTSKLRGIWHDAAEVGTKSPAHAETPAPRIGSRHA